MTVTFSQFKGNPAEATSTITYSNYPYREYIGCVGTIIDREAPLLETYNRNYESPVDFRKNHYYFLFRMAIILFPEQIRIPKISPVAIFKRVIIRIRPSRKILTSFRIFSSRNLYFGA